jgi:cytochrome c peroxidase
MEPRLGKRLFRNEARCSSCHQSPNFTDVLSGPTPSVPFLHDPVEVGMNPGYADRTGPENIGRRRCLRSGSTHPISATAVHPICPRS